MKSFSEKKSIFFVNKKLFFFFFAKQGTLTYQLNVILILSGYVKAQLTVPSMQRFNLHPETRCRRGGKKITKTYLPCFERKPLLLPGSAGVS